MARRGENIRKRKDGRWEARYIYTDKMTGERKTKSLYAAKYSDVKEKLRLFRESVQNAEKYNVSRTPDIRLDQAAEKWLETVKKDKKYSTYIKYCNIYKKYLKPAFGNEGITELCRKNPAQITSGLVQVSESIRKSIYCVLNQILSFCGEYYNMEYKKFSYTRHHIKNMPAKTLTSAEQTKLIDYLFIEMDSYKLGILLCLYTGLRLGEICALEWADIDMTGRILYVNRSVQRIAVSGQANRTSLREDAPKSNFSKRMIPIPDVIMPYLQRFHKENGYVITPDKPTEPRTLQYQFKKMLMETGISDHNFHTLRHTFATNCITAGADVKSISEILGHANVNITLNKYVHPTESVKRKIMNGLASFYGQFLGQDEKNPV